MQKLLTAIVALGFAQLAWAAPNFKIIKDELGGFAPRIERTVEIELPKRITTNELTEIAQTVYKTGYKYTLIGYHIEGERLGFYWATTHYLPNLDVDILGATSEEIELLENQPIIYSGTRLGTWIVLGGIDYKATISKGSDGTFAVSRAYSDGSKDSESLTAIVASGQIRYYPDSGKKSGQFFTINSAGVLHVWDDKRGMYYSTPKLH